MFVKNTGAKVIGFGSMLVLPGETRDLPAGYDKDHPVIKFYIEKGFLEAVAQNETPAADIEEKAEAQPQAKKAKG